MKVFARLKNGNERQIELFGDTEKIISFIENYKGDDLGNDIILEDFVLDYKETGVEIDKDIIELINPFSYRLEKKATQRIKNNPIYKKGEYKIYKYTKNWYIYTFKNIIIAERTGMNKGIIDNLYSDIHVGDDITKYHNFDRPKEAIETAIKAAKELDFIIY